MSTPIETAERARREQVSAVKRLRVLATSDPARGDDLADALVRLTGERLSGLDFAAAAADAPEAVLLAARILARNGAAGPYTSPADATRFFTASALLAATQCGLGQEEAAGRTLAGVDGWLQQLGRLPLRDYLEPTAVIWSLVARARSLLATDAALANACADAAAQRLYAAGLDSGEGYLAVAVHLCLADCRWAAGLTDQSVAHHRLGLAAYSDAVGDLTGRVRPGVAQVALTPVAGLFEPYALRLEWLGEPGHAVAVRRAEVARLKELGASDAVLGSARARLAGALARQGRGEEAQAELAEAVALDVSAAEPHLPSPAPGEPRSWTALSPAQALAPDAPPDAAILRLQQDLHTAVFEGVAARLDAERAEDQLRRVAESAAAERAADREEAERLARAEAEAASAAAGEQDRRDAEEAAARREAEEAAARAAADERRQQLADDHHRRLVVDPETAAAAAAELAATRDRVREAAGELTSLRDAQERLVGLLRPLALVDPGAHRAELVTSLEALVGLRWRLGDPEGSREAAREARSQAGEAGHVPA